MKPLKALIEIERFIGKNIDNTEEEESWNLGYDIGIIETALKALEIAKKVFKCNSLYEHHIDSAYENGWITKEEFDLLKEEIKGDEK